MGSFLATLLVLLCIGFGDNGVVEASVAAEKDLSLSPAEKQSLDKVFRSSESTY